MRNEYTYLISETTEEIKEIRRIAQKKILDKQEAALYRTERDFSILGWKMWTPRALYADGQFERLERSAMDTELKLVSVNESAGAGIVDEPLGSFRVSGKKCECSDFAYRGLPCKHMYFLAGTLIAMRNDRERKTKF